MDYEKKYKEALERARKLNSGEGVESPSGWTVCEVIFPELKESEDERIRRVIRGWIYTRPASFFDNGISKEKMLAWLEKQGKQESFYWKPTKEQYEALDYAYNSCPDTERGNYYEGVLETLIEDLHRLEKQGEKPQGKTALEAIKEEKVDNANKVDPKFHEGDWVIDKQGIVHQISNVIENVTNHTYGYDIVGGGYFNDNTEGVRLWTIQDAKDGDVLYSPCCKLLWIYKDEKTCHVGSNLNYNFGSIVINKPICIPTDVHPATKEQRDTLMKAMTDAGYTFDFEKKELKNIEQKSAEWSEEDDYNLQCMIAKVTSDIQKGNVGRNYELIDWLKSLKDRIGG